MNSIGGRLYRLVLLGKCLVASLFARKAVRPVTNPSTVIVALTGKLGDIVCGTPVLRSLRIHLKRVRIVAVGGKVMQPLLQNSDLADEYIDIETINLTKIKAFKAEAALVTGPSFVPTALFYLAGVPLVISPKVLGGYSPGETIPYRILQQFVRTFPYRIGGYAPRERLRALEPLGIFCNDTAKTLGFSETAARKTEQFFRANAIEINKDFIVGMSLSAGHEIKEWPVERFAKVAEYLYEKYKAKIIIIGSDKEKSHQMNKILNKKFTYIDSTGKLDIDTLKAVISKLNMFISVDTGPIYIAEAFNIPTIDITGPIDEREQPPRGEFHRNVIPPDRKKPELFVLNARSYNREEVLRQIESITPALVEREIDILITSIKRQK